MKNLLSLNFWLNFNPGSLSTLFQLMLVGSTVIFLLVTIASAVLKKSNSKKLFYMVWKKLYSFGLANFILGVFFIFFTYETVPFFSSRFWFLAWFIGIAVWLSFIALELSKIPEKRRQLEKEAEYKKYIP